MGSREFWRESAHRGQAKAETVDAASTRTADNLSGVVVVRRRTDDDLAALVQITARVRATDDYPTYLRGDDYNRFLTRPESLEAWVAERDGRICGHVALNAQVSPGAMQVCFATQASTAPSVPSPGCSSTPASAVKAWQASCCRRCGRRRSRSNGRR